MTTVEDGTDGKLVTSFTLKSQNPPQARRGDGFEDSGWICVKLFCDT